MLWSEANEHVGGLQPIGMTPFKNGVNQLFRRYCSCGLQFHTPESGKDRSVHTYCDSPFLSILDPLHPHTHNSCTIKVGGSHTYQSPTCAHHGLCLANALILVILVANSLADSLLNKINKK